MKNLKEVFVSTENKLKRRLTSKEECFLKWLHERHLQELNHNKIKNKPS